MVKSVLFNSAKKSISNSFYAGQLDEYEQLNAHIKQYWAHLIFTNNHKSLVISTLQSRYPNTYTDIINFTDPTLNPLRRVAEVKSVTYAKPPVRRTANPQLQILLNKNSHKINRALDQACKVVNYAGNVVIWPVVALENGEATNFQLLVSEPHLCFFAPCYNDLRYDIVAKYQDYYLISEYVGDFAGDRRNYVLDSKGKETVIFADVGTPVFASLTETNFGLPRCVAPVNDLIFGTVALNIMEAFGEKSTYLKSFLQPVETDSENRTKPDRLVASPQVLWPASVDTISLANQNNFYEELIQQRNINLCGQHGLSKIISTGDFQNEQSFNTVSQELLYHYEQSIENFKYIEKQLWENVCDMQLIDIKDHPAVYVRFTEPYPSMRQPKDKFELDREKVKAGIMSTYDQILEEHPELNSVEEAKALHRSNLEAFADETNMKRELNISDSGNSPQVNGQMGALAKKFGELGKDGPSVDGKQTEVELIKLDNSEA